MVSAAHSGDHTPGKVGNGVRQSLRAAHLLHT